MYDSKIGRWAGQDLLGFLASDANLYRYVHNEPTTHTDPSGFVRVWTKIRFWYNGSGGNGGIGNPYYTGVAYPVGRVDVKQEVGCTQNAGYSKGGMAVANTALEDEKWEYGVAGTYKITKTNITCGPDILGNTYPGINVTIEAKVSYVKGALFKHVILGVFPNPEIAAAKAMWWRAFGFGTMSLAGVILAAGVGFYNWVYDFESFNASAKISYDVCCQCCANDTFQPSTYPTGRPALTTNLNQLAIAVYHDQLRGCNPFGPQKLLFTLNAGTGAGWKAVADKEWDARVTPGLKLQEETK